MNGTAQIDRVRSLALVILLALALAVGVGCRRSETERSGTVQHRVPVRLQTDWFPQPEHGGFYQALARGFYAEAGLEVTILPGGPGTRTVTNVIGGAAELGIYRSDDLLVQASQGAPLVMVGAFMQHDPQALLLHASSPVHTFADLDGATVMAMPGTNWIQYLERRYDIQLRIVPMNWSLTRFMGDPTFVQQCFVTNEPYFARLHGVEPKTLLIADSGFDPYRIIFTTRRYLRENPEVVRAFVAASLRGWSEFIEDDPAPGKAAILARNEQMTEPFVDFSLSVMRERRLVTGWADRGERLGLVDPDRLQEQTRALVGLGILREVMPVTAWVSPDAFTATSGSPASQMVK